LEAEKLRRENEKLAAETRLLNRPWCLQASYIAAILPIIALCGTCFIAYRDSAAYRDAQEARRETARARADRDSFRKQVEDLRREKDELERGKKALETQRDQVAQQVKDLDSGLKARGTVEGLAASAMKGSKQAFEGLQEIASGSQADLRRLAQSWVESVVSKFSLYSSPAPAGEGSPGTHGMSVVVGGREKWVEQTSTADLFEPLASPDQPDTEIRRFMAYLVKRPKSELVAPALRVLKESDSLRKVAATCGVLRAVFGKEAEFLDIAGWKRFLETKR
jgi:hypothetical protein